MVTQLRVLVFPHQPWFIFSSNNNQLCDGILCELIKYLSKSLNFTYSFYVDNYQIDNLFRPQVFKVRNYFKYNLDKIACFTALLLFKKALR